MKACLQTTKFGRRKAYGLLIIQQNDKSTHKKKKKDWEKILAKLKSGLTTVQLKQDPPVSIFIF